MQLQIFIRVSEMCEAFKKVGSDSETVFTCSVEEEIIILVEI